MHLVRGTVGENPQAVRCSGLRGITTRMDKHHPLGHRLLISEQSRPLPANRVDSTEPLSFKWGRRDKKRHPCGDGELGEYLVTGSVNAERRRRRCLQEADGSKVNRDRPDVLTPKHAQVGCEPLPMVQECVIFGAPCGEAKGGDRKQQTQVEPHPRPSGRRKPKHEFRQGKKAPAEPPFQAAYLISLSLPLPAEGWKERFPTPTPW